MVILRKTGISLLLIASLLGSCKNSKLSKQEQGAVIGVGSGAVIGGVIGNRSGNTAVGAIIGAAVGGTTGALIGIYMDKQARELEKKVKNAKVERIGEGIKMTFDSGLLFGFDSYTISEETKNNLKNLADVLQEYDETDILVEGHTDSVGDKAYNLKLSNQRAQAVSNYLKKMDVQNKRIRIAGYGENQPLTSNENASGQKLNRRVEVVITANDKLKRNIKKNVTKDKTTGQ